jgi:histidinol-phosphate aminotransferase
MDWKTFFSQRLEPLSPYQAGMRKDQIGASTPDRVYKLSSNESPLPPFPSALAAIQACALGLNEYPDPDSYALREGLSARYGLPIEQIALGNGSNELIDLIAATCLTPGDNAVYPWPSFVVYRSSTRFQGAESREVPLRWDGSIDLAGLLTRIDARTKLVYICTPNNPTGAAVSASELEFFLANVPAEVLVVVDAAYEEFVDAPSAARPLDYFDGERPYVVLRTFSKAYGLAGLRCGYAFAPAVLVDALAKIREPFNVNSVAQAAALACLNDDAELDFRRELTAIGKAQLQDCFEALNLRYVPSQANFVWVEVPDAKQTFTDLLARGIIVRPFPTKNALRVTIGDAEATVATIAAFSELFRPET